MSGARDQNGGFGVDGRYRKDFQAAVSRLIRSFLFEVSATDPLIYVACVLVMMLMAAGIGDSCNSSGFRRSS